MEKKRKNKFEFWAIFSILFLNLVLLGIPLFKTSLLPGFDSPFYLYMSSQVFQKENFWQTLFSERLIDRLLTFVVPAIISQLSGITPIISLKIFLLGVGSLQALGMYLVGRKLYGVGVGLVSSLVSILILGYLRIFSDLYANFFAISVVPFIFLFLIRGFEENKTKKALAWYILAGILTGVLFFIHNLTSVVVFFGVIVPWFLGELLFFRSKPLLWGFYLVLSLVVAFPSLRAWVSLLVQGGQKTINNQSGTFPFVREYFPEFIQFPFLVLGTIGILWLFYDLFFKKKFRSLLPFVWNFVFLGASQQQILGFNFFPERFVASFTQPFSLVVGVGMIKTSIWLKELVSQSPSLKNLKNLIFPFFLILVFVFSFPQSLKYIVFGIRPSISQTELAVFQKISPFIKKDDLVVFSNIHHYWFQAILSSVNIEPGEFYLICGEEKVAERLKAEPVGMSYVLSSRWDVKTSAEFLKKHAQRNNFQKVFVYLNLGDKCVEVKKFEENSQHFQKVYGDENGFRLYKLLK